METLKPRVREALRQRRQSIAQARTLNRAAQDELMREVGQEGEANRLAVAETLARLVRREERELAEIDRALAHLERSDYGQCIACGRSIGRQRLLAIPETLCCETCSSSAMPEEPR